MISIQSENHFEILYIDDSITALCQISKQLDNIQKISENEISRDVVVHVHISMALPSAPQI